MIKSIRSLQFLFILFSASVSSSTYCQQLHLSAGINRVLDVCCPVCKKDYYYSQRLLLFQKELPYRDVAYHNACVSLKQGNVDSSYQYLSSFLDKELEKDDTLFNVTTFLKAKILYYKSLHKEALPIYLKLLRKENIPTVVKENVCTNTAEIQLELGRFEEALAIFDVWQTTYKQVSNPNSIKSVYCNIGLCYLHTKDYTKASNYFDKSVAIAKQLKDTAGLAILYENIANQYYNQYLDDKAVPYFVQALLFAKQSGNTRVQMNTYGSLSVVEENRSHFQKALDYLKQYVALSDSLFKRDDIYNLVQNEKSLAIKERDHQVQLEKQANRLQALELTKSNLEISKQKQLLYSSTVLAAAFLSFFAFALYAYRQKSKQNKIISAQREELDALNHTKNQLFSVVAHDLRSPVQTMKVTLTKLRTALTNNSISQAEQVAGEIDTISNTTYSLLNNLLYWALSQTGQLHFTKDNLNLKRIVDQVLYDYVPVAAAKNIDLVNEVASQLSCSGDMNTLKIIFRNLIDNAIKFSEASTKIIISAKEENDMCLLAITDSGKGIDPAIVQALNNKSTKRVDSAQGKSTGIGLWLVKTMAEKNGGRLQIEKLVNGTRMIVHLPKYREYEQAQNTNS